MWHKFAFAVAVNVMLNLSNNNFVEETLRDLRRCT